MHGNCDLRHLQRRDLHCVLQVQEIISKQLSGIAAIDIRTGSSPAPPRFQPISIGAGSLNATVDEEMMRPGTSCAK